MTPDDPVRQPRYLRQLILPGFGEPAQRRLARSRVAVVGAGGLGSPVLAYLAAAGVGRLTIVDDDVVDVTNLHRQVVHPTPAVGTPKVDSARRTLAALNPGVEVVTHRQRLTAETAGLLAGHDVVVDASDNFATRYLVDDAAADTPVVWGSLLGFDGQVTVFDHTVRYRDVFPAAPADAPTCETAGVLGPVAGMVGSVMALEVVKLVTGVGRPLTGRLLVLDGLTTRWREIPLRPVRTASRTTETGLSTPADSPPPDAASPEAEPLVPVSTPDGPQVVDLRDPQAIRAHPIPGSIPLTVTAVLAGDHGLDPAGRYLFVCETGRRSALAAGVLRQDGFTGVSHVPGGVAGMAQIRDERHPKA